MSHRDDAMEFLSDGQWHTTIEIGKAIGLKDGVHSILKKGVKWKEIEMGELVKSEGAGYINRQWRRIM